MNYLTIRLRWLAAGATWLWLVAPAVAVAQPTYDAPWGMHHMWGMWGLGMGLFMLVFWGLVIAALVYGVRWLAAQGRPRDSEGPLDIAKRRYAAGEISREQFEALKRDLG